MEFGDGMLIVEVEVVVLVVVSVGDDSNLRIQTRQRAVVGAGQIDA